MFNFLCFSLIFHCGDVPWRSCDRWDVKLAPIFVFFLYFVVFVFFVFCCCVFLGIFCIFCIFGFSVMLSP